MKLTGRIIARRTRDYAATADRKAGTIHTITVRDGDNDELIDVVSFVTALDQDPRYPLDGDFSELVAVSGFYKFQASVRLLSEAR